MWIVATLRCIGAVRPWCEARRTGDKSEWDWTIMIRQPDAITADLIAYLANEVAAKKSIPAARQPKLTSFEEGAAAQDLLASDVLTYRG